jgi:hypothetical protein
MTLLDSEDKLTFGAKHKGEMINDVINKDIQYCLWLKDQAWVQKDEALFSKIKDLKEPPISMPWGKFKGVSIKTLYLEEPKYVEWLKDNEFIMKNKKVYSEICKYV